MKWILESRFSVADALTVAGVAASYQALGAGRAVAVAAMLCVVLSVARFLCGEG